MEAVAVELRSGCKGCGMPVPLAAYGVPHACNACKQPVELDDEAWHGLFARVLAKPHEEATCPQCRGSLPDEAAQFAARGFVVCPACGNRLSIRVAPPALARAGVALLVGEDAGLLAGTPIADPDAVVHPIVMACLACRNAVRIDGSDRVVACPHCAVGNYVPDELWLRMHRPRPTARWYACLGGAPMQVAPSVPLAMPMPMPMMVAPVAVPAQFDAAFAVLGVTSSRADDADADEEAAQRAYSSLESVVVDANQLLYAGGEINYTDSVFCMDAQLGLRWVRADLGISDIEVTYDAKHHRVIAWHGSKHSAIVLSAADGSTIATIGGREPDHATEHGFDLKCMESVVGDLDGTILAITQEDRLLRYDPSGKGIATWPPHGGLFGAKAEKLIPLHFMQEGKRVVRAFEHPYVETVGNHPTTIYSSTQMAVGWDGRLYLESSEHVACFDRTGKRVYRVKLPIDDAQRFGADHQGNLYVLARRSGDPTLRVVLWVSPDGSKVDTIATDRITGGTVGDEDKVCVGPDGTIYLLGYGMAMRVLAPNGLLQWQSDRSKQDDADEDAEAARDA